MEPKVSLIVPTLGNRSEELTRLLDSLSEQKYNNFEVIVVSQDNHEKVDYILSNYSFEYQHISIDVKGLSIARNEGLKYTTGNIVTFSDDDCWYPITALESVIYTFKNNEVEVACFKMFDPAKLEFLKNYPLDEKYNLSKKDILTKSSIEIFVNLDTVSINKLKFDTSFGLGAPYPSGEENIFLMDIVNNGHNVSYFPILIVYHEKYDGFKKLNDINFIGKGALFVRLFNYPTAVLLMTVFYMKKRKFINKKLGLLIQSLQQAKKYHLETKNH